MLQTTATICESLKQWNRLFAVWLCSWVGLGLLFAIFHAISNRNLSNCNCGNVRTDHENRRNTQKISIFILQQCENSKKSAALAHVYNKKPATKVLVSAWWHSLFMARICSVFTACDIQSDTPLSFQLCFAYQFVCGFGHLYGFFMPILPQSFSLECFAFFLSFCGLLKHILNFFGWVFHPFRSLESCFCILSIAYFCCHVFFFWVHCLVIYGFCSILVNINGESGSGENIRRKQSEMLRKITHSKPIKINAYHSCMACTQNCRYFYFHFYSHIEWHYPKMATSRSLFCTQKNRYLCNDGI